MHQSAIFNGFGSLQYSPYFFPNVWVQLTLVFYDAHCGIYEFGICYLSTLFVQEVLPLVVRFAGLFEYFPPKTAEY